MKLPIEINGPGKYDDVCTVVREITDADGAIVIIIDGNKGSGFSVQCKGALILTLPDMLEYMAEQMRESTKIAKC